MLCTWPSKFAAMLSQLLWNGKLAVWFVMRRREEKISAGGEEGFVYMEVDCLAANQKAVSEATT